MPLQLQGNGFRMALKAADPPPGYARGAEASAKSACALGGPISDGVVKSRVFIFG